MRKLILWDMVTLNGLFEGPDQDIGWIRLRARNWRSYISRRRSAADRLLFGRITYEMMANHWPRPRAGSPIS